MDVRVDWLLILASTALVLLAYGVWIAVWRLLMHGWRNETSYGTAARIWFVSGLGKYVPGKVWALTMMGVMAKHAGISPLVATASSVFAGLLSIVAGFGLVLVIALDAISAEYPRVTTVAIVALVAFVAAIIAAPFMLPRLAPLLGRAVGKDVQLHMLPMKTVWVSTLGAVLTWVMYGAAFLLFSKGVLDQTAGDIWQWIAVYSASYLAGFLAVPVPGGIGVREAALVALMPRLGLTTASEAVLIAVTSRLWLTVLEIGPALVLLRRWHRRSQSHSPKPNGSN